MPSVEKQCLVNGDLLRKKGTVLLSAMSRRVIKEAVNKLESQSYDVVILDIMGGRGFDLLDLAVKKSCVWQC